MSRRSQRSLERRELFEAQTGRQSYVSGTEVAVNTHVRTVWHVTTEVLRPALQAAKVDLFPDPSWGEPFEYLASAARGGWKTIHSHAAPSNGMGVWIDLADDSLFGAFRDYGIESIHCLAYGDNAQGTGTETKVIGGSSARMVFRRDPEFPLVYNHDQGGVVIFEMTKDEAAEVRAVLHDSGVPQNTLEGPLLPEDAAV